MSQNRTSASLMLLPDLLAKQLNVTAVHADGIVNVAAVVENIGEARASGPFRVDVGVTLGGTRTFFQSFEVPSNVTLSGRPVFEQFLARGITIPTPFQTRYTTPPLVVPLIYRDEDPTAVYTAEFIVDEENQVAEANESNNHYTWPGTFWFLSPAAKRKNARIVVEHPRSTAGSL